MSKYLQQLVMESIGKQYELGNEIEVNQGIAVYGNKGSTDQHAYVQQLRDGLNNFFVTFIEVQRTRKGDSIPMEGDSTSADFLQGFFRGTRDALYDNGRQSITISISELNAYTLGGLIALYERAVSFYASLVNINAYHQPGVEAGKKAAGVFLDLLSNVKNHLAETGSAGVTAADMAGNVGESDVEKVYHCLNHLAGTGFCTRDAGNTPGEDCFRI
jgi:glucose-6-phosphate isomerase